jgi:hypothetical protein
MYEAVTGRHPETHGDPEGSRCWQEAPSDLRFICTRATGHDIPNSSDDLRHMAGTGTNTYVAIWDDDRSTD